MSQPTRDCGHDAPTIFPAAFTSFFPLMMRVDDKVVRELGDIFQGMPEEERERIYGPGECATCWAQRVSEVVKAMGVTVSEVQANINAAFGWDAES